MNSRFETLHLLPRHRPLRSRSFTETNWIRRENSDYMRRYNPMDLELTFAFLNRAAAGVFSLVPSHFRKNPGSSSGRGDAT
jgi:hypothetical protein